jgi:SAM-dependent methyltransferase
MKEALLDLICCPEDRGDFKLSKASWERGEIVSGELRCSRCGAAYAVADGVPVILKVDGRPNRTRESFGREWTLHAEGRFESDTVYGKTEEELLAHFRAAFDLTDFDGLANQMILDAGCGSGRLTAAVGKAARNATIVGIDFSDAAKSAYRRCRGLANVHILQCDILRAPFRCESFDYGWSVGVLHHTPETSRGFEKLSDLVKKGGRIYIWIYSSGQFTPYRLARKLLYKPYLLPPAALYALSWGLAAPLYFFFRMRRLAMPGKNRQQMDSIAFSFYDVLSPEFMHFHSEEEVGEWFVRNGFGAAKFLRRSGDISAAGTKAEVTAGKAASARA